MTIDRQKRILSNYDALIAGTGGKPCVCVHGRRGTGKTALLNNLTNSLLTRGANVYFAIDRNKGKKNIAGKESIAPDESFALRELLRQLVRLYGDKSDPDFIAFIMSYVKRTPAPLSSDKSAKQFGKDSLIKFIYDCLKAEPIIFVIDDLDRADTFTIKLVGNLLKVGALSYLIFSHSDKLVNKLLSDILYENTELIKYVEMRTDDDIFAYDGGVIDDTRSSSENLADATAPLPDETVLVLSKPGRERQLIKHYMKSAQTLIGQMAYEKAASTYRAALDVFAALEDTQPDDKIIEAELLMGLGEAQLFERDYISAAYSYNQAFRATDMHVSMSPCVLPQEIIDKRAAISIKLAECYSRMNMPEREREQIMLSESFFCVSENRTHFYDLYKMHILKYLNLLTGLGEGSIFREKLKQAYSVCLLDDKEFTCSLYCEEAYMCMENGKFEKAEELLYDAQAIARECESDKLWDEVTNTLAICSEQMGKPFLSTALWKDLCKKSCDPVKVAEATVNAAMLSYEQDGNVQRAGASIKSGVDLFILAGEDQMAADIVKNLEGTPLAEFFRAPPETLSE